jgi:hypothetical protein
MRDPILADGRIIASCGKPCRARFLPGAFVFILLEGVWRAILISGEGIGVTSVLSRCKTSTQFLQGGQEMSRRTGIVLISVIVLILGIEVAVRLSRTSRSGVEIANLGEVALENLVVSFGGSQVGVGNLAPGGSTHVWLSGKDKGSLSLSFTQAGNPMSGFLIPEFDPRSMHRDGLKMVIHIKPNEVMKFMDDEQTSTPLGRLGDRIRDWVSLELNPAS